MLILVILLTLPFCFTAPMSHTEQSRALKYFKQYGYLPENYERLKAKEILLDRAIRNFEKFAKIKKTGEMNTDMMKMMKQPRCGMKDMNPEKTMFMNYVTGPYTWKKSNISYKIIKHSQKISKSEVEKTMQESFDIWARHTNLKFFKTDGKADINIGFYAKEHTDANSFDGPGNVLAHASFPTTGIVHFDEEENWDLNLNTHSINLFQVATHEIGHALGLHHSHSKTAIMRPFYNSKKDYRSGLDRDDIKGIQYLYGTNNELNCTNKKLTSIILQDDVLTIFKDGKFMSSKDLGEIKKVGDVWKDIDEHSKVLATTTKTYFFSGNQYWRFTGRDMDEDYPQKISDRFPRIPDNIDAAVEMENLLYFFKGNKFWAFDSLKIPRVSSEYPKLISEEFWGLPNNLETIVWLKQNKEMFAIKDGKVYIYSFKHNRVHAIGTLSDIFSCKM